MITPAISRLITVTHLRNQPLWKKIQKMNGLWIIVINHKS